MTDINTIHHATNEEICEALQHGPVMALIQGSDDAFNYLCWGSIVHKCDDSSPLDEWVTIVGYHYKPWTGERLWRVKFGRGPSFGESGYAWIKVGDDTVGDSTCGINTRISYIDIDHC